MTYTHPAWASVGMDVQVVRTFAHDSTHVVEEHPAVVVRQTPTLIVTSTGEKFRQNHPVDPEYHLSPRYMNYRTTLKPKEAKTDGR